MNIYDIISKKLPAVSIIYSVKIKSICPLGLSKTLEGGVNEGTKGGASPLSGTTRMYECQKLMRYNKDNNNSHSPAEKATKLGGLPAKANPPCKTASMLRAGNGITVVMTFRLSEKTPFIA